MASAVPVIRKVKTDALNYVIINKLLFSINTQEMLACITPNILLVMPEKLEPVILHNVSEFLVSFTSRGLKIFLTICKNYFLNKMLAKIYMPRKACDICQRTKFKSLKIRSFHPRIPTDHSPMKSLSVDITVVQQNFDNSKHLLVTSCKIINFILAIHIKSRLAQVIGDALFHRIICILAHQNV